MEIHILSEIVVVCSDNVIEIDRYLDAIVYVLLITILFIDARLIITK
jgi:hypothetical protein